MSSLDHRQADRSKVVFPGGYGSEAVRRNGLMQRVMDLLAKGLSNAEIRAHVDIGTNGLTELRRIAAEGDLSAAPCPKWVWPEHQADYRRLACLPTCDEGGERAAAAWAREAQRSGRVQAVPQLRPQPARVPQGVERSKSEDRRERILNIQPLAPSGNFYASSDLIRLASVVTEVPEDDIKGACRDPQFVKARHIVFWLLRTFTDASLPQIGRRCGGRDHTTVLYGWRKAEAVSEGIADFDRTQPRLAAASLWALPWPKVSGYKLKKRGRV